MGDMLENKCLYCMDGAYDSLTGICPVCHHEKGEENNDHQLPRGSVLGGRYLVGRALGQGGFGITYIGWDIPKSQKIAIKEYFPSGCTARKKDNYTLAPYDDSESINIYENGKSRFLNEAERLKEINDVANVVRVSAFFSENNTAYIIMDYVEGINFKKYLFDRGGKTSLADALEKLHPIVTALSQIHKKNILHRDISPDNIILSPLGAVLIDFGAAREYSFETPTSKTINVKTGYAPMEQYDTHGKQGPWTDVFAFASTIYRAVTGILPANAIKRSENSSELRLPHELNPDINPMEEKVLLKGMEIDIQKRYQDIDTFYRDMIAAHASIAPLPLPIQDKPVKEKKHKEEKAEKEKKPKEKKDRTEKKNVFRILLTVFLILSTVYTALAILFLFADNSLYIELFVQQLLTVGAFGFMSALLLRSLGKKGRSEKINMLKLISLVLFAVALLSAIVFSAVQNARYYQTLDFGVLMSVYLHIPLIVALNILVFVYSKKKYNSVLPDFKSLWK